MFSYKPLLRLLVEKNMTKTQLREAIGMSMNTLAKISKNEYVSMSTLDSICKYFHCKIEDIIEFIEWFILCHLTHDWSQECAVTLSSIPSPQILYHSKVVKKNPFRYIYMYLKV